MFKLPIEAIDWAKGIAKKEPFMLGFDIFYLFFLAGLVSQEKKTLKDEEENIALRDIINSFPGEYNSSQRLIINLLLITEKNKKGIPDDDKNRLRLELLEKYINPENNSLTTDGFNLANSYAYGGYRILEEKMPKPEDPAAFITSYLNILKKIEKK
jgi:hypothetical protein